MTGAHPSTGADTPRPVCFACGRDGALRYLGEGDRLFGAPGAWNLARCRHCGVLWLHPTPPAHEIAGFYRTYYTHEATAPAARLRGLRGRLEAAWVARGEGRRGTPLLARAALAIPFWREELQFGYMDLRFRAPGRLLDVGCGSGDLLGRMAALGWQVEGVEMDAAAAAVARERTGATVHEGGLQETGLQAGRYDAVTMSHVVEHVPDPAGYLTEAWRVCRPGGRLVVATPNAAALGHRLFGASWRGLEVPRHLHLYTVGTLTDLVERAGFRTVSVRTSARAARWFFVSSRVLARGGGDAHRRAVGASLPERIGALLFQLVEDASIRVSPAVGEELLLVAERPGPRA